MWSTCDRRKGNKTAVHLEGELLFSLNTTMSLILFGHLLSKLPLRFISESQAIHRIGWTLLIIFIGILSPGSPSILLLSDDIFLVPQMTNHIVLYAQCLQYHNLWLMASTQNWIHNFPQDTFKHLLQFFYYSKKKKINDISMELPRVSCWDNIYWMPLLPLSGNHKDEMPRRLVNVFC